MQECVRKAANHYLIAGVVSIELIRFLEDPHSIYLLWHPMINESKPIIPFNQKVDHLDVQFWLDYCQRGFRQVFNHWAGQSRTGASGNVTVFVRWKKNNFTGAQYNLSVWLTSSPTWGLLRLRSGWTRDRWPTAMYWHFLFKYKTTVCCVTCKRLPLFLRKQSIYFWKTVTFRTPKKFKSMCPLTLDHSIRRIR